MGFASSNVQVYLLFVTYSVVRSGYGTDVIAHTTILVFWTPDSCRSIFQYVNESINIDDYINQGKSGLAELRVPGGTLLALALVADGVLMIGALRRMRRWMSRPRSAIHFLRPP